MCAPPVCSCDHVDARKQTIYTSACNLAAGIPVNTTVTDSPSPASDLKDAVVLARTVLERVREEAGGRMCDGAALKASMVVQACGSAQACPLSQEQESCMCGVSDATSCVASLILGAEFNEGAGGHATVPLALTSLSPLPTPRSSAAMCAPSDSCTDCDGPATFLQCVATLRQENLAAQRTGYSVQMDEQKVVVNASRQSEICRTSGYYLATGACGALWHIATRGFEAESGRAWGAVPGLVPVSTECPSVRIMTL